MSGRGGSREAQEAEIDCCPTTADAIPCVWKRRREGTAGRDRLLPHHSCDAIPCVWKRRREGTAGRDRLLPHHSCDAIPCVWKRRREGTAGRDRLLPHHSCDAIPCVWKRRREGTGRDRLLPHHSRCYTLEPSCLRWDMSFNPFTICNTPNRPTYALPLVFIVPQTAIKLINNHVLTTVPPQKKQVRSRPACQSVIQQHHRTFGLVLSGVDAVELSFLFHSQRKSER